MDVLFMLLGFIPTAIAVVWFWGSVSEGSPASIDIIGSLALGIFGISLTGNLRSFANDNLLTPLVVLCCACFIITAICIYIKNKNHK